MDHKTKLSEQSKHVVKFNMYKTYIKQIELEFHDGQVRLKDTSVHLNDLEGLSNFSSHSSSKKQKIHLN